MYFRNVCRAVVITSVLTIAAWAQSTVDGAIGGIVADPSSAVVPDAAISARNVANNASSKATSDIDGRYLLAHL